MSDERYALGISAQARRQLAEEIPAAVAFAAHEFIRGRLLDNPRRLGKPLRAPLEGHFSARMGTYRVIYVLDEEQHSVDVVAVVARSDAYRSPG
jgi:mRNA interferase RelE/StbE